MSTAAMAREYGRLTVQGRAGTSANGEIIYWCRCACGERRRVRGGSLRSGRTKSCGDCARVTGEAHNVAPVAPEYGRLKVEGRAGRVGGEALYRCVCACGTPVRVRSSSLRRGKTQSCGCLRDEHVAAAQRRKAFRRRAALWFGWRKEGTVTR